MILYIQERAATGATRRIPSLDVYKAVTGNMTLKQQLNSQLGVENLLPQSGLSAEQLKQYLDNPPTGRLKY